MKIKKLELNNFRPFRHLDIDFNERVTVLVGINGAGKTSILDALAILLSRLIGRIRSTHGTGRFFTETDIRLGASETANTIKITFNDHEIFWRITKTKRGRKKQTISNLAQLKEIIEIVHAELERDENASIPLAVYYGVNRAVLDIPLRIRKKYQFDQLAAFDQALTGARNDFRLFFEWFRKREDFENERRLYPVEDVKAGEDIPEGLPEELHKDLFYRDPQLQAVREAVHALTGFSNLRVRRSPLRMEVRKGKQHLNVAQLSDGEKCLLALAGDLARRLAIANPSLSRPIEGKGVVLIDEVELHLHPEWQHRIIPKLLETFPGCQFVLTTHSPQVLSNVRCENIWCLEQKGDEVRAIRPDGTYGQDSNFLLKTLFGSSYRPKEIEKDMERLFELIRKDTRKARKLLDKLKIRIEGESPDLVRAETILHRREVMGK